MKHSRNIDLLCALAALALLCGMCSGCAITPRAFFYAGQGYDTASTAVALDRGYVEDNPMADDMQDVLLLKAVLVGAVEFAAWLDPEHADSFYKIGGWAGLLAGGWNTALMASD